ncbi:Ankyrin repeat-containing protein BDA1 [Camellia lanceoleosa]|uniref:Ankyrin repeat-containing protein BDA1 n=1 Tax=Camellia lanceoleosa TaxID=1840588 RepID=A0ACC0FIT1_9ERIC|nr:Ankyrin repeat-containing protein BDA1 [Camellia lanceoleosa]
MDERLIGATQTGDVETLYNLIQGDPFVLDKIDQVPFADTPLHVAISANQTHFAKEIASLKPSFVVKLNQYGYSPIHLVAMVGQAEIVKELITIDPKLCLLKGREKTTPLHCAAMAGHTDVINLLLDGCPQSLVELTIWNETALHLAVKSNQFKREVEDFKIIKDGLKKIRREEVLNWKDKEGNTVLHLATFTKQYEIIKILLSTNPTLGTQLDVNAVNGNNQTALDILFQLRREKEDKEIETILHQAGTVTAGQIITPPPSTTATTPPKTFELKGHPPPINSNSIMIIASILLAITCFLTRVYPLGGVWQYDYNYKSSFNATTTTEYKAGTAIMAASTISVFFMFFNLYGFFAFLLIICVLIKGSPLRWLFLGAVAAFSTAYLLALALLTPDEKLPAILNIFFSASAMFIFPLAMEAWIHYKKCKGSQVTNGEVRVKGKVVTPHGLLA